MIFQFFRQRAMMRALQAGERRFRKGWDWAAGELLRGVAPDKVLQNAEEAFDFGDYDRFDEGVVAACNAWESRCAK